MCRIVHGSMAVTTSLVVAVLTFRVAAQDDGVVGAHWFDDQVRPLLAGRCVSCHGSTKQEGRLRLDSRDAVLLGGDRGSAVVAGDSRASLLIEAVKHAGDDLRMPPAGKLSEVEIALLARWIDGRLPWSADARPITAEETVVRLEHRRHWAFQPLRRPTVPAPKETARLRNEVDAFIQARLEPKSLSLSSDASRYTLVRRAFFDLLGLPPTPEDVESFVNDSRPDAYERLLDRLLVSPHFGERWGRHWLDNAGYADVYGGDNDATIIKQSENKWRYRDYVVDSFNRDQPFDRFVTQQLAGDECIDWRNAESFTADMCENLIATCFLRNSADDTNENELNTMDIRYGVLHRTIEVAGNNLLALTLTCAKCHDHKYEPITQRDYYRFQAIFQPALNPDRWLQPTQRQLPALAPRAKQAIDAQNADLDRTIAGLKGRIADVHLPHELRLREARLATLPAAIRADTKLALETPADKRTAVQRYLAERFPTLLQVSPEELAAALSEPDRATVAAAQAQIKELNGRKKTWEHWQVIYDAGPPTPTRVLTRGNHLTPADEVTAGGLTVLTAANTFSAIASKDSSGRRLALAHWLTETNSPAGALVIRVRVNRIWQQLFGLGIVETTDNFGVTGSTPTHPELLEWLATEFCRGEQRLKPFLKTIMMSTVYRQTSEASNVAAPSIDPDNHLLWRQRLRRLESEAVRDALVALDGGWQHTLGGAPIPVDPKPDGSFVVQNEDSAATSNTRRRSIYLLARRNYHPTLLSAFDQPNMTTNCTSRSNSAVVLQPLAMLNDKWVLACAQAAADRVCAANVFDCVQNAFLLILSRPPTDKETKWCRELLEQEIEFHRAAGNAMEQGRREAVTRLCHSLLNTSEFLYIP